MVVMMGLDTNAVIPNITTQNVTNRSQDILKGGITSIQNDVTDNNTWIIGGVDRIENLNSASPMFNTSFYILKTDGTGSHSHDIMI